MKWRRLSRCSLRSIASAPIRRGLLPHSERRTRRPCDGAPPSDRAPCWSSWPGDSACRAAAACTARACLGQRSRAASWRVGNIDQLHDKACHPHVRVTVRATSPYPAQAIRDSPLHGRRRHLVVRGALELHLTPLMRGLAKIAKNHAYQAGFLIRDNVLDAGESALHEIIRQRPPTRAGVTRAKPELEVFTVPVGVCADHQLRRRGRTGPSRHTRSTCASTIRARCTFAVSGRWRQAASVAPSCAASAETWDAEIRSAHRVSTTVLTLRMLTP